MDNPLLINVESSDDDSNKEDFSKTEPLEVLLENPAEVTQPAPQLLGIKPGPFIATAQHSDVGVKRPQNQDTAMSIVSLCGADNPIVPFAISLVADGMGGHADGADASKAVATYMTQNLTSRLLIPMMRDQSVSEPVQDIMNQAVLDASRTIHISDQGQLGGTTLTCGVIIKSRLFIAHVGDSRAYLYDHAAGELKVLTEDHTYVQQLLKAGEITEEEAAVHPKRNLLFRAITGSDVEVDLSTCALPSNGVFMVCSDGLWGHIDHELIKKVIAANNQSLQQKCEQLVAMAIEGGTTDNISVVLTEFRL